MSSSASGSARDTILTAASALIGSARSASWPSTTIATARFASDLAILSASSLPVMPLRTDRLAPSGNVTVISLMAFLSLAAYHAGKVDRCRRSRSAEHQGVRLCSPGPTLSRQHLRAIPSDGRMPHCRPGDALAAVLWNSAIAEANYCASLPKCGHEESPLM